MINDLDLFEDAPENEALYGKYLAAFYCSGALGENYWNLDKGGRIPVSYIWIFEDIYSYEGHNPWKEFENRWPVEVMLETLSRYFDGVTREAIIGDKYSEGYDPAADTIIYSGGRGGGPFSLRVTSNKKSGDLLSLYYRNYDPVTGIPYDDGKYILTVRLMPDGSFHYVSNLSAAGDAK